jgi:hypothetical protein
MSRQIYAAKFNAIRIGNDPVGFYRLISKIITMSEVSFAATHH